MVVFVIGSLVFSAAFLDMLQAAELLTLPALIALVAGLIIAVALVIRFYLRRNVNWIAVDGSNVLYWHKEKPALRTVRRVIEDLMSNGYQPVIWFDANVGYLVQDKYMGPAQLARALSYPERRIFVAVKGTPADPAIIEGAGVLCARIVSNDRFRDWVAEHPQVGDEAMFVRGRVDKRGVQLTYDLNPAARRAGAG